MQTIEKRIKKLNELPEKTGYNLMLYITNKNFSACHVTKSMDKGDERKRKVQIFHERFS